MENNISEQRKFYIYINRIKASNTFTFTFTIIVFVPKFTCWCKEQKHHTQNIMFIFIYMTNMHNECDLVWQHALVLFNKWLQKFIGYQWYVHFTHRKGLFKLLKACHSWCWNISLLDNNPMRQNNTIIRWPNKVDFNIFNYLSPSSKCAIPTYYIHFACPQLYIQQHVVFILDYVQLTLCGLYLIV